MKNKNNILIAILIIIFVIFQIFILIRKDNNYIYIGNFTKVTVKKNNIKIINKNKKLDLSKVMIYFNEEFIPGYIKSEKSDINNEKLLYNAYDTKGNTLQFTDDLIAYTGDKEIKIASPNILELPLDKDNEIINDYIFNKAKNKIETDYQIDYRDYKKIIFDIDNDGDNETIYSLDVVEGDENEYSYVFIVDDEEIKTISEKSGSVQNVNLEKILFFKLIDFDNDGKYEIVLRLKNGDYGNNYYKIYSYNESIKEIK